MIGVSNPLTVAPGYSQRTTPAIGMHRETTNRAVQFHRHTASKLRNRQQWFKKLNQPAYFHEPARVTQAQLRKSHRARLMRGIFKLGLRRKKSERNWVRQEQNNPAAAFPTKHKYLRELQEGAEGAVQAWNHEPSGTTVAVKVVKSKPDLPREVELLTALPEHKNIIKCLTYFDKQPVPEKLAIVLEYCPGGDLYEFYWEEAYSRNMAVFSEAFMWSVFNQLSSALAFLHEGIGALSSHDVDPWRPIVHRDLKFENVLVQTTGLKHDWSDIVLKLADFGLSSYYDPVNAELPRGMGTTFTWAPEVTWTEAIMTPAADVWSLGGIIHSLVHGFGPLACPEMTKFDWYQDNIGEPYPEFWSEPVKQSFWGAMAPRKVVPINIESYMHELDGRRRRLSPKYSDELNECLMMALKMDPQERASAARLLEHIQQAHSGFLFRGLAMEAN
jgi:serine/threonine protein kinase